VRRRGAREGFAQLAPKSIPAVPDESLLEEMRTALQGDRERAQVRRRAAPEVEVGDEIEPDKNEPDKKPRARRLLARLARPRRRT